MTIVFIILAIVALVLSALDVISWILGLVAFVVLIAVWFVVAYNHFVRLVNHAKEAWSDIDVQLKRRYDLIPNLVNTVKGYATHESTAFEKVTQARAAAMGASTVADKSKSENMLEGALKSIFAIAEAYPDLKANTNFLELQRELSDTENKIQASRRFYNGNVRELNTGIEMFPNNIVAKAFNFSAMEYFELEEEAAKNPVEVKF
jgi:LemA protein